MDNLHEGHRNRMRELVDRVGLENLNEIQALEFTLYYILPRKNTNEIAHELLKKFGSFAGVLDAYEKDLVTVKNIGLLSAKKITQLKHIINYYKISKLKHQKKVKNILEINKYFKVLLEHLDREHLYAIAINENSEVVAVRCMAVGSEKIVTLEKRDLLDFAFTNKVNKVALGHNHPTTNCMPSKSDDTCTAKIMTWLNSNGLELIDHVIVGKDETFSFKEVKIFKGADFQ